VVSNLICFEYVATLLGMSGELLELLNAVSALREVDAAVDFARGWLQLRILLTAGHLGRCSVDRLVEVLGERRKAVLDSLRKMRAKGLVEGEGQLNLTEEGRRVYETLVSVLAGSRGASAGTVLSKATARDIPRDILRFSYLYDVLIALGTSKGYELPLSTLASVTRLSPTTLEDYLKPYVEEEPKLFKRIVRGGRLTGRGVLYRLTDEGLKVYHRLPDYVKYKNSLAATALRALTRSGHPRIVLKRVALALALGSAITSASVAILAPPASMVVALTWVLAVSLLALLVEVTY